MIAVHTCMLRISQTKCTADACRGCRQKGQLLKFPGNFVCHYPLVVESRGRNKISSMPLLFLSINPQKRRWEVSPRTGSLSSVCSMAFSCVIPRFSPIPPSNRCNIVSRKHQISAGQIPVSSSISSWASSEPPQLREISISQRAFGHRPRFLQMGLGDKRLLRQVHANSANSESSGSTSIVNQTRNSELLTTVSRTRNDVFGRQVVGILHLAVSLGIILAMDKLLKQAFVAAAIKFPSALFGMFCVFSILLVLDSTAPSAATSLMNFFEPATLFIQRWLPLFYVPSLVVLPLAVKDIPAASGLKILLIVVGGWLASLFVAGYTALTVRKIVKTEMIPAEPMAKPSPFSSFELWSWTAIFVLSFAAALLTPIALGTTARTSLPFLLAATVLGYMVGSGLPSNVKTLFHPIICCALSADVAAIAFGYFSRSGTDAVLGDYLTKVSSNPGAGDILMGFLGSVIISFAFSMFKQRKLVKRHAAEIFSSVIIATIFSLYSTAILGRLAGLEQSLSISILPRCITVALALSIVSFFDGSNPSLTAAVVVLTGLVGANFVQAVLDRLQLFDPIARGLATASSAHGLGTAALSAKEPEALPFCAIAYALTGIFGSLLCSIPAVRQSLILIVG